MQGHAVASQLTHVIITEGVWREVWDRTLYLDEPRPETTWEPRGALLFSCLGRGRGLYGTPDHDSKGFERHLGALPLAGFFGNGEIGPVGGRTYTHGYTSVFGVLRPRRPL